MTVCRTDVAQQWQSVVQMLKILIWRCFAEVNWQAKRANWYGVEVGVRCQVSSCKQIGLLENHDRRPSCGRIDEGWMSMHWPWPACRSAGLPVCRPAEWASSQPAQLPA